MAHHNSGLSHLLPSGTCGRSALRYVYRTVAYVLIARRDFSRSDLRTIA